jgi:hypothetical protein
MPLSEEEPGGPRTSHRRCPGAGQIRRTGPGAAEDGVGCRRQAAAGEVAGLLLVEVLCSPRARAPSLDLARSLAGWLAGRRPPASARAEVTTRRVPVVKDAGTSVLVHRVETALVVLTPESERMRPLAQSQPGQGRVGAEIPAGPDQPGHVRGSRDLHDATRLLDPADQSHWGRAGRRE